MSDRCSNITRVACSKRYVDCDIGYDLQCKLDEGHAGAHRVSWEDGDNGAVELTWTMATERDALNAIVRPIDDSERASVESALREAQVAVIAKAIEVLAEFARTAPGRLPDRVQRALQIADMCKASAP